MMSVGITGGIGSGKSTVCKVFKILGTPVYHADEAAKKLMNEDNAVREAMKKLFGGSIYLQNGTIDRKKLASHIFNDTLLLDEVNRIVHPVVRDDFRQWLEQQEGSYVLHEAAILFESGFYEMMHLNIVVTAPVELRVDRVMKRDGSTRNKVISRMKMQWDEEKKIALSDYIITNDGESLIIPQILTINQKLEDYGKAC